MRLICLEKHDFVDLSKSWTIKVLKFNLSYLRGKPHTKNHRACYRALLKNLLASGKGKPANVSCPRIAYEYVEEAVSIYHHHRKSVLPAIAPNKDMVKQNADEIFTDLFKDHSFDRQISIRKIRQEINDLDGIHGMSKNDFQIIRNWFTLVYIFLIDPALLKKPSQTLTACMNEEILKFTFSYARIQNVLDDEPMNQTATKDDLSKLSLVMSKAIKEHRPDNDNTDLAKRLLMKIMTVAHVDGLRPKDLRVLQADFANLFLCFYSSDDSIPVKTWLVKLDSDNTTYLNYSSIFSQFKDKSVASIKRTVGQMSKSLGEYFS